MAQATEESLALLWTFTAQSTRIKPCPRTVSAQSQRVMLVLACQLQREASLIWQNELSKFPKLSNNSAEARFVALKHTLVPAPCLYQVTCAIRSHTATTLLRASLNMHKSRQERTRSSKGKLALVLRKRSQEDAVFYDFNLRMCSRASRPFIPHWKAGPKHLSGACWWAPSPLWDKYNVWFCTSGVNPQSKLWRKATRLQHKVHLIFYMNVWPKLPEGEACCNLAVQSCKLSHTQFSSKGLDG